MLKSIILSTLMKKLQLRAILLKDVNDYDDAIQDAHSLRSQVFPRNNAKLFWKLTPDQTPTWIRSMFPSESQLRNDIHSNTASGVLIVRTSARFFAVTFGYGRALLHDQFIESRFGLRVVLNMVDPDSLRSIDTKSLDGALSHTKEQLPALSSLSSFGIDVEKDFIRAVTGVSTNSDFGKTISGVDVFSSTIQANIETISVKLDEIYRVSQLDGYKQQFGFIDNISEVSKSEQVRLNDVLVAKIQADDVERIWLAPPEIVDWSNHGGFSFTPQGTVYEDIGLRTYLSERIPDLDTLTAQQLIDHKLHHRNDNNDYDKERWSIFRCLYAEIEEADSRFILSDGKWFQVNKDYVRSIESYLQSNLDDWTGTDFPEYETALMAEKDSEQRKGETRYNAESVDAMDMSLMDRKMIPHGAGGSKIEVCDMYKNDVFVHIKRYTASSGLSHLFNQGKVSTELLRNDTDFRQKVINRMSVENYANNLSTVRPDMQAVQIVFAVVSASRGELKLPFFSQVALRNAVYFLKNTLDVGKVCLVKIQAVD